MDKKIDEKKRNVEALASYLNIDPENILIVRQEFFIHPDFYYAQGETFLVLHEKDFPFCAALIINDCISDPEDEVCWDIWEHFILETDFFDNEWFESYYTIELRKGLSYLSDEEVYNKAVAEGCISPSDPYTDDLRDDLVAFEIEELRDKYGNFVLAMLETDSELLCALIETGIVDFDMDKAIDELLKWSPNCSLFLSVDEEAIELGNGLYAYRQDGMPPIAFDTFD